MGKWTRRAFIGTGTLVGGGFLLGVAGFTFAPNRLSVVSANAASDGELNTWIAVTPDNLITVLVPHCEMGQGTQTALAMMAAEEMEAEWDLVRVKEAPALGAYANAYIIRGFIGGGIPEPLARGFDYGTYRLASWFGTQMTGGSTAVRATGHYGMRIAGAAAKEMLIAAAAARFNVKAADCKAVNSRVMHSSGVEATFGELAAAAAKIPVPTNPTTKDPDTYTIRRTARARFDIPSKVDGSAIYGMDFTLPGMLYAAVEIAPVYGGKLMSVDTSPAEARPGVLKIIRLDEAVAVVADSYWHARQALGALKPQFDDAGHGGVSNETIFAAFDKSLGAAPEMPKDAAKVITADYQAPFLAHATMEPMACTAKVEGDRCDVWVGVQDPLNARSAAAKALKFDVEQVHLTNLLLGGGFGRRLPFTYDYVDLGVRIAKAMSPTPVKLVWSRENDIQHDYYRPAGMMRFAGALDKDKAKSGAPIAVASHYAGGGDGESTYMPYAIASKKAEQQGRGAPDPDGRVEFRAEFFARVLQGVVHRRDGPRGGEGRVSLPARSLDRSAALPRRPRARGQDGGLGQPAARGRGPRDCHHAMLRHHRRRGGARGGVSRGKAQGAGSLRRRGLRGRRQHRQRQGAGRGRDHLRPVGGDGGRNHHRGRTCRSK